MSQLTLPSASLHSKASMSFPLPVHALLSHPTFLLSLPFCSTLSPLAQFPFFSPIIILTLPPSHDHFIFPESKNERENLPETSQPGGLLRLTLQR